MASLGLNELTHWGWNKIVNILLMAISNAFFFNENIWISIDILLKFVAKGQINNVPALVQIMAWRRPGDKPLSKPMMVCLLTHICIAWPQWVKDVYVLWYFSKHHTMLEFLYAHLNYTPVWKTDVLCRGNVRASVRPSVRLSVRPRFPDFFSACFEISIWNLVYTFSRWRDISSSRCITIGSLWPCLQPKVGQTNFLQS